MTDQALLLSKLDEPPANVAPRLCIDTYLPPEAICVLPVFASQRVANCVKHVDKVIAQIIRQDCIDHRPRDERVLLCPHPARLYAFVFVAELLKLFSQPVAIAVLPPPRCFLAKRFPILLPREAVPNFRRVDDPGEPSVLLREVAWNAVPNSLR